MFGVVASGSPSSWIAFRSGGCGFVRNFSHIKPGRWINLKPMRVGVHPEATMRTWGRPFSSDNGDKVDVVVPALAESISNGTIVTFLQRSCGRANVDEPIAQIETDKLLANEGDTVEPGDATHVAPFKTTSEKAAPKPTQKDSEEKKTPKVETTLAEEKPKAPPSTLKSPTETQLPLKETERRVDRQMQKVNGYYKRPLPSPPALELHSSDGKQLFLEAFQNGTMECFLKLISNFQTQSEPTFCGLATLSMVLNALAIDPCRRWKGSWRWFDESMLDLDCCVPLEKVRAKGISFRELVCLAQSVGAKVEAFRASSSNIEEFRKYVIECSTSEDRHVILSYHRAALKQTGNGHISPIGGYHGGKDMALILDVARFKYPPHWVPLEALWKGMSCVVDTTGQTRGFMVLSRPHREPSMLDTLA